jgi:hypothetical protein
MLFYNSFLTNLKYKIMKKSNKREKDEFKEKKEDRKEKSM